MHQHLQIVMDLKSHPNVCSKIVVTGLSQNTNHLPLSCPYAADLRR
jgi:hypothetical protein